MYTLHDRLQQGENAYLRRLRNQLHRYLSRLVSYTIGIKLSTGDNSNRHIGLQITHEATVIIAIDI